METMERMLSLKGWQLRCQCMGIHSQRMELKYSITKNQITKTLVKLGHLPIKRNLFSYRLISIGARMILKHSRSTVTSHAGLEMRMGIR